MGKKRFPFEACIALSLIGVLVWFVVLTIQDSKNTREFLQIYGISPRSIKTDDERQYVGNWIKRKIELLQTPVTEEKIDIDIARIIIEMDILRATVPSKIENASISFYKLKILEGRLLELRRAKNEGDFENRIERAKELAELYGFYPPTE